MSEIGSLSEAGSFPALVLNSPLLAFWCKYKHTNVLIFELPAAHPFGVSKHIKGLVSLGKS